MDWLAQCQDNVTQWGIPLGYLNIFERVVILCGPKPGATLLVELSMSLSIYCQFCFALLAYQCKPVGASCTFPSGLLVVTFAALAGLLNNPLEKQSKVQEKVFAR